MKKFFSGLAILPLLLLSGCQDDIIDGGKKLTTYPESVIAFSIDGNKTLSSTRADAKRTIVAPSNVIDLPAEEGMPSLCLVETVTSLDDTSYDAVMSTRGTPVYTENFGEVYGGFYGTAFEVAASTSSGSSQSGSAPAYKVSPYLAKAWFAKDSEGNYVHDYESVKLWPSNHKLYFFLETQRANDPDTEAGPVSKLNYYQDGSFSFDYISPAEAPDQEDILFTSKIVEMDETGNQVNNLLFYHPLTGVKFKLGMVSEDNNGVEVTINSIDIKGIIDSGHCVLKPNYTDDNTSAGGNKSNKTGQAATKSAACATWTTDADDTNTFFFVSDGSTVMGDDAAYEFPESFYAQTEGAYGTTADYNLNDNKYSNTFWFIPQTVSPETGKTNVTIKYTVTFADGTSQEASAEIALNATWQAGELHTYTLAFRQVHVSIDDEVSGNVKSGLTTPNTGNATEWQRIVLSANWVYTDVLYDEGDVIIEPYDLTTSEARALFTNFPGTNWIEGADGFFYYKYPIEPGKAPNVPLFTKFTAPEPTIAGTHLEMSISVQAVKFDASATNDDDKKATFKSYWSDPCKKGTTDKVSGWLSTGADPAAN